MFVVPTWAWHEHRSGSEGDAVLFSIHDRPVIQALWLYREEPYEANGGPPARDLGPGRLLRLLVGGRGGAAHRAEGEEQGDEQRTDSGPPPVLTTNAI